MTGKRVPSLGLGLSSLNDAGMSRQLQVATLTAAVITATVPLGIWLVKLLQKRKREKHLLPFPPGPKGHWLFGNSLDLPEADGDILPEAKVLEWAKEYGLVLTLHMPFIGRMIVICDPTLAKQFLLRKNVPKDFTFEFYHPLVGHNSMLVKNGDEWAKYRKVFNPGFSPGFMKTMLPAMSHKLDRLCDAIDDDIARLQSTPTWTRASRYTSDVIAGIALGEDWGQQDVEHEARRIEQEIVRLLQGVEYNPLLLFFGEWHRKFRIQPLEQKMDRIMLDVLEKRLAERNGNSRSNNNNNDKHNNICSLAIDMFTDNSSTNSNVILSDEEKLSICHQLRTFYFAGHDTSTSTIAWALWNISQYPAILTKLRQELSALQIWTTTTATNENNSDGRNNNILRQHPTYEQLQNCRYLEAVINETLRLFPPAGSFSRHEPDETFTYNGYQIGGGGGIAGVNLYVLHRHPDLWKEAETFRPERFLDGSEGSNLANKFMPFSRGPRDCIGKYFAMVEAKLVVSRLVMDYDVECIDPTETLAGSVLTYPSCGAKLNFTKRRGPQDTDEAYISIR